MSFRDDHAAALARAKALEQELDEAEKSQEATEAQLEAARREIAELRAQIPPPMPPAAPATAEERRADPYRGATIIVGMSIALTFIVVMGFVAFTC